MVAPTRGEGREILRALARHRGRWLGIEVTTVRPLALELVGADLASAGLALLDEFAEQALVDELLDEVLEAATDARHIHELAEGAGFRTAVRKAIVALRLAGVDADRLAKAPFGDQRKGDVLSALYSRYLEHLARGRRVDTADVLIRAAEATRMGAPLPGDVVLLLPGLGTRGLAGRFLTALQSRGARCLPTDPVAGVTPPNGMLWNAGSAPAPPLEPELFRAAGITEELREMLRRVLAWGHRWDEIEIVTPDPGVYGPALHALAERLGVPVTFAVGLPFERTRAGRVVATYLRWLHDSFPDPTIRRLLETGDLASPPPYADVDGPRLARALRRLRVGWGRDRYLPAIASARRRLVERPPRPRADEEPAATAARAGRAAGSDRADRAVRASGARARGCRAHSGSAGRAGARARHVPRARSRGGGRRPDRSRAAPANPGSGRRHAHPPHHSCRGARSARGTFSHPGPRTARGGSRTLGVARGPPPSS